MPEQQAGLDISRVRRIVEAALEEDGARCDVTTKALVPPDQRGTGAIIAKAGGVVAGLSVASEVYAALDAGVSFAPSVADGDSVSPGDVLARIDGPLASLLSGERVALNFLQRLSGIATATRKLVEAVAGLDVAILDTRKTTPGLRELERHTVRLGGGHNHRFNLSDAVLIKDNHLAAFRERGLSVAQAVHQARRDAPEGMTIEVEVTTLDEARQAIEAAPDIILFDNMSVEQLREAVALVGGRALTEASGGVSLERVRAIAETGVDRISAGAITHSAPALDMSLEVAVGRAS
ncbi:MAG: carboxylating nicotinate-nucleotide diphosphorylase [Dehalococcoidia bacterium]